MKNVLKLFLLIFTLICLCKCKNQNPEQTNSTNEDSIKNTIIGIIAKMREGRGDKINGPANFESFCEDSVIFEDYDDTYFTSSKQISHDLASGTIQPPHDIDFHLYGQTAIISYVESFREHFYNDTIYHEVRAVRTFVNDNGKWKLASGVNTLKPKNYHQPIIEKNQNLYNEYAGIYQVISSFADTFFVKDKKLYYAGTGGVPQLLFPVNESEYMVKDDLVRVIFGRNPDGKVGYYYMVRPDGQKIKVPKVK
ncbi:MAG: hypothetical protein JST75_20175 [Bacteroidetes bacterium]|nr:hypothetical protein [Bacteroidota bacterium]